MGRRVKETIKKVNKVTEIVGSHHTGAYAAQAAYFFCTLYDSDHPAFADGGTVYTGYLCKCHRCSGAGVSDTVQGFIRSIVTQVYFFPVG